MEATRLNLTTLALTHGSGSALAHGDLDSLHGGSRVISRCPDQATIKNACHLKCLPSNVRKGDRFVKN